MYIVERAAEPPALAEGWDSPSWRHANILRIEHFHPRSSAHRPPTQAKALYDAEHLYVMFHVRDQYVRAVKTQYQSMVCRDSCVELFLQPKRHLGYFNFEINCCGTLMVYYIEDPTPEGVLFRKYTELPPEFGQRVRIHTTLAGRVDPEIRTPVEWTLAAAIPLAALEPYVGTLRPLAGRQWRGNFYKCADETSHPHWGAWSPIGKQLAFHQPQYFGPIQFAA